jgi:hypothetical protein
MWIVFCSGRNVYVVDEPFYFHSTPINPWGAKSGMLHAHAQLNPIIPYKPFTNLPLAFLVF